MNEPDQTNQSTFARNHADVKLSSSDKNRWSRLFLLLDYSHLDDEDEIEMTMFVEACEALEAAECQGMEWFGILPIYEPNEEWNLSPWFECKCGKNCKRVLVKRRHPTVEHAATFLLVHTCLFEEYQTKNPNQRVHILATQDLT